MFKMRSLVQTCVPAILAGLLWGCDAPKALEPDMVPSSGQETSGIVPMGDEKQIYWERTEVAVGPPVFTPWQDSTDCIQQRTKLQQYKITIRQVVQRLRNGAWVNDGNWIEDTSFEWHATEEGRDDPNCHDQGGTPP
jgi:hypothetical protein